MNAAAWLVSALAAAAPVQPAGVAAWTLSTESTPLLGGRFTVRLPAHARAVAEAPGPLADAPVLETRVEMEEGGERIVLLADETLSTAPDGLRDEVEQHVARSKDAPAWRIDDVVPPDARLSIVSIHNAHPRAQPDGTSRAISFHVRHPDGLVQVLTFFASSRNTLDLPAAVALGQRVVATLAVGPRAVDLAGGVRDLAAPAKGQAWKVRVPPGFVVTAQQGPDFTVQRIVRVSPFHERAPMLGLYTGKRPAMHWRNSDAGDRVTTETGVLMGRPVQWARWAMDPPASTRVMLEAQHPLDSVGGDGPRAHAWLEADTDDELRVLRGIALSMVLAPPPPSSSPP